jgi:hypothetical protein
MSIREASLRDPPPRAHAAAVRPWDRDVRALAEALFARPGGPPPPARLEWLCDDLADFLARSGPRARLIFHACRLATTWLAPLHARAAPPLRRQPLATRARALAAMERGPLAMAVLGVKAMMSMMWYEHPDSAAEIGHDGRCHDEAT